MLELADLITRAVAKVKTVVESLRVDVEHRAYTGPGVDGPSYAATTVTRTVLHEPKERLIRRDGLEVLSVGTLTFLDPVTVQVEDKFTLPSGRTVKCLEVSSPPGAAVTEVLLGATGVSQG